MCSMGKTVLVLVAALLFSSGCTLHFKAKELELDSEHTPRILKNTNNSNITYELTHIDLVKQ